ncbi:acyltransferase family protein [Hymenobacter sp. BT730]|uniref:acyltransferase family protein n=1 Tax=Hymenobacter sp. BT730 TaxID=3063332 RepID=UPI0026DF80B8|nr:acyltransferase family protein [Hymenobacter sp. BT730]
MSTSSRLHSLDALRSTMMLLCVIFHSALAYAVYAPFPVKDIQRSPGYDYMLVSLLTFGMPVFFVMAGLFSHLVYQKRGAKAFLQDRLKRILLPFLAGWLLICPLVQIVCNYYSGHIPVAQSLASWYNLSIYQNLPTHHLWFLYYLFQICLLMLLILFWSPALLRRLYQQILQLITQQEKNTIWLIFALAILSAGFIVLMQQGTIATDNTFIPNVPLLLLYTGYFGFGFLLYSLGNSMYYLFRQWKLWLILSFPISIVYFLLVITFHLTGGIWLLLATSGFCALLSWLMIFGLIGLFHKYFSADNKIMGFLSQASYWVYLIHFPLVIWVAGYQSTLDIFHLVKYIVSLFFSVTVLLLSYKYLVQYTPIRWLLNGRK